MSIFSRSTLSASAGQIHPLTAIRAFAALWVIFFHFHIAGILENTGLASLGFIWERGYLGVDLFFILSGFVLSYVHQSDFYQLSSVEVIRFYILRIARVFPVHYMMLGVYLLILGIFTWVLNKPMGNPDRYTLSYLLFNLLNIQAWGSCRILNWNIPAWSVSAEWFAYLCFPGLAWVLNKTHHYRFILLGTLVAFLLLAYVSGKTLIDWTVQGGLYRIGLEFVLGAALYNLLRTQAIPGWITQGLFIMGLAGCWLVPAAEVRDLCAIVSLGCLISSLAQLKGWGLRLLSVRPMVYLGEISYSIYMVHLLCLQLFQATIYKVVSTDMKPYVLILLLICIYVLSALIFRFVEVPCRRKIRTIGLGYLGNASPAKAQL